MCKHLGEPLGDHLCKHLGEHVGEQLGDHSDEHSDEHVGEHLGDYGGEQLGETLGERLDERTVRWRSHYNQISEVCSQGKAVGVVHVLVLVLGLARVIELVRSDYMHRSTRVTHQSRQTKCAACIESVSVSRIRAER